MTEQARVVVIGGGVVGFSCRNDLAALGVTDALLIERDELKSGSTWHAATVRREPLCDPTNARLHA